MKKSTKAALAGLAFVAGCEIGIAIQLMKMIHKFTVREKAIDSPIPDDLIEEAIDEALPDNTEDTETGSEENKCEEQPIVSADHSEEEEV